MEGLRGCGWVCGEVWYGTCMWAHGAGTCACKGRSIISSVSHHLVAVRQGFSLNQKLVILARLAGQWDLGLLLSLPANVGVMVIHSHVWPFKCGCWGFQFRSSCLQALLALEPSSSLSESFLWRKDYLDNGHCPLPCCVTAGHQDWMISSFLMVEELNG